MTKEILTIEFRYYDSPNAPGNWKRLTHISKTITIGIYDTLEEAVKEGNKTLDILSKHYQIKADDRFAVKGSLGIPNKLVVNQDYAAEIFVKISTLNFANLEESIKETFNACERYKEYQKNL